MHRIIISILSFLIGDILYQECRNGNRTVNCSNQMIVVVLLCGLFGCAAGPNRGVSPRAVSSTDDVTILYGKPNRLADGIGYAVGLPERLLTLNQSVNNHEFSEATRQRLVNYLKKNNVTDVCVRVNQYDPVGEWHRLTENPHIVPGWKYSVGLLPLAMYTLLPGRIFGGDKYNPYTNSLYINSDVLAVALHEAAYAKDILNSSFPGTYATINEAPFVSLWRHVRGVRDVVTYAQAEGDWDVECETYRSVFPMIGIHIASGGFHSVLGNEPLEGLLVVPLLPLGGAFAGHVAGELAVSRRRRELGLDTPDDTRKSTIQLASWQQDR